MKFLNTDAIHESGALLYNKPVKENFKITTAPCPVFENDTYIEFDNYKTYKEEHKFNFQKVEFYYEPNENYLTISESDYPDVTDFNSEDGIVVKVYKLIGIIGTNLFGEQDTESNISQLCLYRAFELINAEAKTNKDKYNITYYLYSYYSKGNLDYSKRYYLGENIPSGKYEVSYSSLTLNDKAIKGEAVKINLTDIKYPTNANKNVSYPIFGHKYDKDSICAPGKYYELKIYKSDNECPIYLPMQEGNATVDGKVVSNNLVVNVNYSGTLVTSNTTEYYHTINNLDKWDTQEYCMYNTIHGYTTNITDGTLETIKYFPVANNEYINTFINKLGGDKHDALKTGINDFENIVLVPNSTFVNQTAIPPKTENGYKVSEKDYVNEVKFKYGNTETNTFNSVTVTNYEDQTTVGNTVIIYPDPVFNPNTNSKEPAPVKYKNLKGWCIYVPGNSDSSVTLNKNELYKFTAKLTIKDDNLKTELSGNNIFDIKFILLLDYDNAGETRLIEFNNNCLKSNVGDPYTIEIEKYFTAPVNQATNGARLACSQLIYKYIDNTDKTVKTVKLQLNGNANNDVTSGKNSKGEVINGFTITGIELYKLTPKNSALAGTFYTKYAYANMKYIGQDTFTLYDNDTHDSEVYREWYYYLDGSKFENNYKNIEIDALNTNGTLTCTVSPTSWISTTKDESKKFVPSTTFTGDSRIELFDYDWAEEDGEDGNEYTLKNLITDENKNDNPLEITREPYNVKHLKGGNAKISCTATLSSVYGISTTVSSLPVYVNINWTAIKSSITVSNQFITSVTDNIIYIGKKYTGTFTITTTYPLKDDKPISINDNNTIITFAEDWSPSFSIINKRSWYTSGTYDVSYDFIVEVKPNTSLKQAIYINASDNNEFDSPILQCSPYLSIIKNDLTISINTPTNVDLYKTVDSGDTKTLNFKCEANANLSNTDVTYQWYKDNTEIDGATTSTYTIKAAELARGTYEYYCMASNIYSNSITSSTVTCRIIEDSNSIVTVGAFSPLDTTDASQKYYVPADAGATLRYKNYDDVQTAINAAASVATAENPAEVWIANGEYKQGYSMTMKNNVAIYGGFSGTETSKDQRVAGYHTILDGENSYKVFDNTYTESELLTNSAKLDNVTIQNGRAMDVRNDDYYTIADNGAGMLNYYASPKITNCTFNNNNANLEGGGMSNWSSSPLLTNCAFTNNSAKNGGGMDNYKSSPVLTNCTFSRNESTNASSANNGNTGGGAIHNDNSETKIITCTFENNTALNNGDGGAITNGNNSTLILTDCTFNTNSATDTGGAISNHQGSTLKLKYCTFTGNQAVSGGAIENWTNNSSTTTLTANYCYFDKNKTTGDTAESSQGFGGAIVSEGHGTINNISSCTFNENTAISGGAIYSCDVKSGNTNVNGQYSETTLTNCTFYGNKTTYWSGGAVENKGSKLTAYYCTFTENICGSNGAGAAIYDNNQESSTVLRNCILWNNKKVSESYSHGYYTRNANNNIIDRTYCVIQNSSNTSEENHIKTGDPELQSLTDNGGFVLTCAVGEGSSAIGNGIGIEGITTDARAFERSTTTPTIGAYEYQSKLTKVSISTSDGSLKYSSSYEFTLNAISDGTQLTYQWYKDGVAIQGATSSSYKTKQSAGTSKYYVVVSDGTTSITSSEIAIETVDVPRYYVSTTGSSENDGLSWAKAKSDVQEAINLAASDNIYGTEVWIAKGTYNHGSAMSMKNNVAIYGGFAGTETSKEERVAGNNTILDGEGKYSVFSNYYSSSKPLTNSAKLDNVTIQNGYTTGDGAGIYNYYASPEITNCIFSNNNAGYGGGMYNDYDSSPTLTNCTFSGNSAKYYGGGMHNWYSSPEITNCTFTNNSANGVKGFGGGMYNTSSSSPVLTNCTFSGNSASGSDYGYGGGMYNESSSSPVLTNCTFSNNSAKSYGGGMHNGGDYGTCNPVLTNCILWGNTASSSGNEIYNRDSNNKATIDTCIINGGVGDSYGTYTNIITADPKLQPLADNGGNVQTIAVASGSSAIGAGKTIDDVTTDARGYIRPTDIAPTIGAYEYNGTPPS